MIEESSFKDYFILALSFLSSFKMFSSKYVWKVQKSLTVQGLSVIFKINVKNISMLFDDLFFTFLSHQNYSYSISLFYDLNQLLYQNSYN